LCDKLTLLNRALHSIFLSYKVELPKIVYLEHAMGTVLGHAEYNDFLVVYQNVTVRSASPHISIGKGVVLSAGATILGNKPVGARSAIGAHTMIFDREIPPDSIVFTDATGQQQTRPRKHACSAQRFFNVEID
jgi:serine O-acetyltransferase